MRERRHDIDWLRAGAMVGVFLFHCARFFGGGPWHLSNPDKSLVAGVAIGWLDLWIMPLFFVLSGAGSWYALEARTAGQYLRERVRRILVPLYGVGLLVLAPPQLYFERITRSGGSDLSFWEFLPRYLGRALTTAPDLRSPLLFHYFLGHLWFLQYLFLISLLVLPLLVLLKSQRGRGGIAKLAGWSGRWGGVLLFAVPLAVVRVAFTHLFEQPHHSWAHFLTYAVFFLIGYIIPADRRLTEGIRKVGWLCLALGVIGFVGESAFIMVLKYNYADLHHEGGEPFSLMYVVFNTMMGLASWSWVVFILSVGARYLARPGRALAYANEAVLPFYVLHQTVILSVGWFVIRRDMGIGPKYLIIAACSFVLITGLYEGLIRHFSAMRFLFGMRPKRRPAAGGAASSGETAV